MASKATKDHMRVAIDMQTTQGQKTGFGFYVQNLVRNLERIDRKHQYLKLYAHGEGDFNSTKRWWWDQVQVPRLANALKADILHQPAFSAPAFFHGPTVVTVHDLIAIHFEQDIPLGSRLYFGKWMPFSYRFADHMIVISEHTKQDVMELLGIPEEQLTVIYEAVDTVFRPVVDKEQLERVRKKYGTGEKFLLHVGTLNPRKNLEFLVKVFAEVRKKVRADWKLVITGKKGWYYEGLFDAVRALGLERSVIFTGYVDDHDKPLLYNAASIFTFPSLYEGAGLPPLEAMSCGVPTVSSDTSSLPEMVGAGGILLSPTDMAGWTKALVSLMTDASLRREIGGRGRKQARRFSWERTARETIRVYERVHRAYHTTKH